MSLRTTHAPPPLRLTGAEKRLLAAPPFLAALDRADMRSPGEEKKLRAYASPAWKANRYSYVEDDEDEFNRPAM